VNFADKLVAFIIVIGSAVFYFVRKTLLGRAQKAERELAKEKSHDIEADAKAVADSESVDSILTDINRRYGPGSGGKGK
jgi:hypothetical protein